MRRPWQITGIWRKFQKSWRIPSRRRGIEDLAPQLYLRPLEERRVLSVGPMVAAGMGSVAGAVALGQEPVAPTSSEPSTTGKAETKTDAVPPLQTAVAKQGAPKATLALSGALNSTPATAVDVAAAQVQINPSSALVASLSLVVAPDQTVDEGTQLAITDVGQFTAPGSDEGPGTFLYTIDWGDGTPADTGTPTIDVPGSSDVPTSGSFDGQHTYADNGAYTVTVTVTDDQGGADSQTFAVTVSDVAPTLTVAPNQTIDEGSLLSITNIGQFTDPGFNNPLNIGGETSEKFAYAIDWGDGTSVDTGTPTIDVPGSIGVLTAGSFDGQHTYADNGTYTVTVTVIDDDGGSASQSFAVTVDNVALTLTVAPNQTVDEGSQLSIINIGQFTDPGFDNPANIPSPTTETFTYTINWGDGSPDDTGTPTIDVPGSPGVLTAGSFDGQHTYADNGVYTVTVTLIDDDGGTASQTFAVTVNNVAPTLTVVPNQTVDEGSLLSLTNIGQFTDPGFDNPANVPSPTTETFTYTINWGDGSSADTGTPTIDVPGAPGVLTAGSFDGQHTYADNGVYTVTVTVTDDDGGATSQTFAVTVNNVAPTLVVAPNQAVDEGSQLSITNIGQFTDPGFDNPANIPSPTTETFTFAINWGDGSLADTGAAAIDTHGSIGVLTAGSFDGQHTYADNGVYTVTVTVTDDDGGAASQTFTVTVGNVAPTLVVAPNQTVDEGSLLSLTNIGQFTDPGFDNPANVPSPTAETFTYTINWGDGTSVDTGAATIDTPGSIGVLTAGSFDGQHTYADNGVYTVTVTVTDDDGGAASQTFTVTVGNVAPTLTVAPNQAIDEGSLLSLPNIGQFTDPGFDNAANIPSPTTETFSYTINWGDGSSVDTGAATIDVPGSPGVLTAGSFDGQHTYADNGVYTVTVTVTDDDGGTASQTFTVTVGNVAPTLVVVPNQSVNEGTQLSITNIGQFTDPGFDNPANVPSPTTETFAYTINWGDGSSVDTGVATIDVPGSPGVLTAGSFDGQHTFADNGVYTVTVTVTDDDGGTASQTFTVTVGNVAPTLTVAPNQTIDEGSQLALTNIGQFTDPAFDNPVNVPSPTTETFTYTINWGDGSAVDSGAATIDVHGSQGVLTAGSFDGQHTYADNGVYTVTVTVTDDDGGSTSQTFAVTVNNVAPTLVVAPNQAVDEGSQLSITNIGQFTDPGFDNPANIPSPTTETFTFAINWGDGSLADTGAAAIDTHGSIGVLTAGSFDGQHTYADNGVYTVTVTVTDDDGGATSQTFIVTVGNVAPTLTVVPNQTVDEGSLLSITNIGQFTDPGFDNPANAPSPTTESFTYAINWGDGSALNTGAATVDIHGSIGVLTAGSFDGQHTYADNGVYTVTVTVTDDDGGTASQTFTVTVGNVAPALTVAPNQTVDEGSLLPITNIGQFTDPGFDNAANIPSPTTETFTYTINWGDGSPVDSGAATIDVPGSPGVLTAGSFDGQHTYADNGVYTVTVTVTDDDGGTASQTFTVTVGNVAPTLVVVPNQSINEGSLLSLPNIGQFTDPGFDNLANVPSPTTETFTYAINWGDGSSVDTGTPTIDLPGSPGVLTAGSFDGQHTYADNGIYTVTVTVTDDDGGATTQTFAVTVNNVAPTLTVVPNQTVNEGSLLSLTNIGQFTDPGFDNPANIPSPTTETFSYTVNWGDGSAVDTGAATIDTHGSIGVLTAGSFDGQYTFADNGVYTVTVTVTDDDGGTASQTFTVTVNNISPTLVVAPNQTTNEGSLLSLTNIGQVTDPGFDNPLNIPSPTVETFTYTINWGDGSPINSGAATIDVHGSPGVLTAGSFDGQHTYADNGTYTVTVTVTDDDGDTASQTFTVTVNNVAPTLVVSPNQTINEGSLLALPNIGQFTDPGFDNPANIPSPTTETFSYQINWGDGSPINSGAATIDVHGSPGVLTAGSFDGQHTYADNGVYTVTVTVTDDDGGSASQTFSVTVNNVSPTLVVVPNQTINEGSLLALPNIGQFTDPGFDNPLNIPSPTAETFTYTINWGDGSSVDAGAATVDVPGSVSVLTAGSLDGQHTYADNGVYTVTVTVTDDDGGVASQTFAVTVNNVAPALVVVPDQSINEGAQLSLPNIGQFTDPGFDNPLNIPSPTTETFTFAVNWGDGSSVDTGDATVDLHGSPGVLTTGSFDAQHTYADNGVYTVTVTVTDDDGGATIQTFTVTVNNVAPTLVVVPNQTINEGSQLALTNIGQLTDPGFDNPLNIPSPTVETFTYAINWGDGRAIDTGAATIDVHGSIGVLTAGSLDGQHTYADNGVYTVTVTVTDDDGGTISQSFTVTVDNVAPTLVVVGDQKVAEEATLLIINVGQFTDPGFDNLLNVGGQTTERFSFAINWGDGTQNNSGAGTIDTPGSPGVNTAGSFDNQHVYPHGGVYTVTVTLFDDDGGVATGTFQVFVGPTLTVAPGQTVNEGSLLSIDGLGQFSDPTPEVLNPGGPNDQPYRFTINWGDGRTVDGGLPALDALPIPGAATSGSFGGSHTYADNGVYTVTVTVTAGDGRADTSTFLVTVDNVAPTLTVVGNQTIGQTRPLSLPNIGKFTDPGFDNLLNVVGETTERFTHTIDWGDGTPLSTGPGTINAPGDVGLLSDGSFNGLHVFESGGNFTVTVTIRDDDGGVATETFVVVVAPIASKNLIYVTNRTDDSIQTPRAVILEAATRPTPPQTSARAELVNFRVGSVAGAETRLVLRVVLPSGDEDVANDEPLANELLDNLRKLFKRLPDGHYRIYQIQPDGAERIVVDVIVREGRSLDAADEAADDVQTPPPSKDQVKDEPPPQENKAAAANPTDEDAGQPWYDAALAWGGYGMLTTRARARRRGDAARRTEERSLTKIPRLLRRSR